MRRGPGRRWQKRPWMGRLGGGRRRRRGSTEALERAANEVERREVEEALRRAEEGEWLEVQRLAAEIRIKDL